MLQLLNLYLKRVEVLQRDEFAYEKLFNYVYSPYNISTRIDYRSGKVDIRKSDKLRQGSIEYLNQARIISGLVNKRNRRRDRGLQKLSSLEQVVQELIDPTSYRKKLII